MLCVYERQPIWYTTVKCYVANIFIIISFRIRRTEVEFLYSMELTDPHIIISSALLIL